MADPIMVGTIVVLIAFLTLFILYPLAILLVDSFYGGNGFTLARCLFPDIQTYFESEEGKQEFAEWEAQQEQ